MIRARPRLVEGGFAGLIDELRLYDRALRPSEIIEHAKLPAG
jgi:hypothetical protein